MKETGDQIDSESFEGKDIDRGENELAEDIEIVGKEEFRSIADGFNEELERNREEINKGVENETN